LEVRKQVVKQSLPAIQPKRLIRALERAGFVVHHVTGSHYILKHPTKPGVRVTVPFHNRDLKRGTLQSIVKQAGFTNEEFLKLL
jgi:predicted RNA binding protein YcfA (HicA-like mRNA interferase family)